MLDYVQILLQVRDFTTSLNISSLLMGEYNSPGSPLATLFYEQKSKRRWLLWKYGKFTNNILLKRAPSILKKATVVFSDV